MTSTPVLFLVFNRPELTSRVFAAIRAAQPAQLFVAADGPRPGNSSDQRLCEQVRAIVTAVDWPCKIQTLFRDSNLGCKHAVSSAISWFFDAVDEGIILEDDWLPNPSFFPYCEELLSRYRTDSRVMMIGGYNPVGNNTQDSYFFSLYGGIWGWASWKRAWKSYSLDRAVWDDAAYRSAARSAINSGWQWKIKRWSYEHVFSGKKNTWDYQWEYIRVAQNGLSIVPATNLIENIGLGADSTHTAGRTSLYTPSKPLEFPLRHPQNVSVDRAYDSDFIELVFGRESLLAKLKRVIGLTP